MFGSAALLCGSPVFERCFPCRRKSDGGGGGDVLLRGYELHSQRVRDGWEPLCDFLEVPVPDDPFPYINDRDRVAAVMATLRLVTWIWPLVVVLPILFVNWLVSRLEKKSAAKVKVL